MLHGINRTGPVVHVADHVACESYHGIATTNGLHGIGRGLDLCYRGPNLIREGIFYIRRTVNALNQSNTTLYSLDLDLLHRPFLQAVDASGLSGLATGTGGRYFFTQSRFGFVPAVRTIGEENRRYYLLTYTPTTHAHEGKYRQIEIRVKRPGFEVKARPGYFAPAASEVIIADR